MLYGGGGVCEGGCSTRRALHAVSHLERTSCKRRGKHSLLAKDTRQGTMASRPDHIASLADKGTEDYGLLTRTHEKKKIQEHNVIIKQKGTRDTDRERPAVEGCR